VAYLEVKKELDFLKNILEQICALNIFESHLQERLKSGIIEVMGVDSKSMKEINATYLHKNKTTDVLSFPLKTNIQMSKKAILGSIVINTELAKENAKAHKHSLESEIILLFVHGLLHILDFNHECDNGEQRTMETIILNKLDIKLGLIDRSYN